MAASSKRRKKSRGNGLLLRGFVASGEVVARNPALAGGTTAFLVSLCFVSANALWYQPHFYNGAFFATREAVVRHAAAPAKVDAPAPKPMIRPSERPAPTPASAETTGAVTPDPAPDVPAGGSAEVYKVQMALGDLGLYDGTMDGLSGPQTREAIEKYQRIVGMETTGSIDGALARHLGIGQASGSDEPPSPTPRPANKAAAGTASASLSSSEIRKIQAGLKAFGNEGIAVDGVASADMRAALKEFQSLFGLPVNGEPNTQVLAKMKDIGLVN